MNRPNFYLEAQVAYVRQALQQVRRRGVAALDVLSEATATSDRETRTQIAPILYQ